MVSTAVHSQQPEGMNQICITFAHLEKGVIFQKFSTEHHLCPESLSLYFCHSTRIEMASKKSSKAKLAVAVKENEDEGLDQRKEYAQHQWDLLEEGGSPHL